MAGKLIINNNQNILDTTDDSFTKLRFGIHVKYGDYKNVTFDPAAAYGTVSDSSLILAKNTFNFGSGINLVYGNIKNLSMDANIGGSFLNEVVSMAGNSIDVGSGLNTIYGNMRDFSLSLQGGENSSSAFDNLNFMAGGNDISMGSGINTVFGTLRDIHISVTGGESNDGEAYANLMENNTIDLTGGGVGNAISAGNGLNTIYGNMRDFTMTVGNNSASDGSLSMNQIDGNTFEMGGNTITLGNGNNVVYGVMDTLNFEILGSSALGTDSITIASIGPAGTAFGLLDEIPELTDTELANLFNMAGNTITVGKGTNIIYGDLKTYNASVVGGIADGDSAETADSMDNYDSSGNPTGGVVMGSNTITADKGTNTIYGNIGEINLSTGGQNAIGEEAAGGHSVGALFIAETNVIVAEKGTNTIYGNMGDVNLIGMGAQLTSGNFATTGSEAFFEGIFSGNQITSLGGKSTIFGSLHDINVTTVSGNGADGNQFSQGFAGFYFQNEGNTILAGKGENEIYGSVHDVNLTATGGVNASPKSSSSAITAGNGLFMGQNEITVLGGDSIVAGNMNDLSINVEGGEAYDGFQTVNNIRATFFDFGKNTITTGKGDDVIYGDLRSMSYSVTGGHAEGEDSAALTFSRSDFIDMGGNLIHAGAGDDWVFGNAQSMSFTLQGGTVTNGAGVDQHLTAASAVMIRQTISMRGESINFEPDPDSFNGNRIYGEDGNDHLFGNLQTLSFSATDGVVTDGGIGDVSARFHSDILFPTGNPQREFSSNIITFGDDYIFGGKGDDVIYGDVQYVIGEATFLYDPNPLDNISNKIIYGNDILEGGKGDDYLNGNGGEDIASYENDASAVDITLDSMNTIVVTDGYGDQDTLVSIEGLMGTAFNDKLTGDGFDNVLKGLGGADTLKGLAGNDLLEGGDGDDILEGGDGDDVLDGGAGADSLDGGDGNDSTSYATALAGLTIDLVNAGNSTGDAAGDTFTSVEVITASNFDDIMIGDATANVLNGLKGNDEIHAGAGNDVLNGGAGADLLDGGDDIDTATYATAVAVSNRTGEGVTVNLADSLQNTGEATGDTFVSIENVTGSSFNDTLVGDGNDNVLSGGKGDDFLVGGAGNDTLNGDDGTDTVSYAAVGPLGVNVNLDTGVATGDGTDTITDVENIIGSAYDDTLTGDGFDNVITGGAGNDMIDGGAGSDTASYQDAAVGVTVDLSIVVSQNTSGSGSDTLVSIENLEGSQFADTLIGDAGDNVLAGKLGNDTLTGGGGADTFSFDLGVLISFDISSEWINTPGIYKDDSVVPQPGDPLPQPDDPPIQDWEDDLVSADYDHITDFSLAEGDIIRFIQDTEGDNENTSFGGFFGQLGQNPKVFEQGFDVVIAFDAEDPADPQTLDKGGAIFLDNTSFAQLTLDYNTYYGASETIDGSNFISLLGTSGNVILV